MDKISLKDHLKENFSNISGLNCKQKKKQNKVTYFELILKGK